MNNLHLFASHCSGGLNVTPQVVIDDLFSIQDLQDIRLGAFKAEEVWWIVELWVKGGCRRVSDQPLKPIGSFSPRTRGRAAIEGIKAILEK